MRPLDAWRASTINTTTWLSRDKENAKDADAVGADFDGVGGAVGSYRVTYRGDDAKAVPAYLNRRSLALLRRTAPVATTQSRCVAIASNRLFHAARAASRDRVEETIDTGKDERHHLVPRSSASTASASGDPSTVRASNAGMPSLTSRLY